MAPRHWWPVAGSGSLWLVATAQVIFV